MNRDQIVQRLLQPEWVECHFEELAMEVFNFQFDHSEVYRNHLINLGKRKDDITSIDDIPFLPISAFKNHRVVSYDGASQICFESSGTTGSKASKHYVKDLDLYQQMASFTFNPFYGDVCNYCVLGLLPSYLERSNSSLVYMVDCFIQNSTDKDSGFYLHDHQSLIKVLRAKQKANVPTILIGVSFALMDLAEEYKEDLSSIIVMETGGMKGKRKEVPRAFLHELICDAFNIEYVHSEYGMTELLSQAYSSGNGIFKEGYAMRCISKQITDPLTEEKKGKTGVLNIIDLANVDTCAFIETQDLVRYNQDNTFELLGRIDQSDLRGCNLLLES